MNLNPLVSVIVPCYNLAEFLPDAINSIRTQTYQDWECIIVDDGSDDATRTVALEFMSSDNRIKYFRKQNGGLASARNFGIRFSCGEFILPLDADDKLGVKYISKAVSAMLQEKNLKLVYCNAEFFGESNGPWPLPEFSLKALARQNMIFCSALFRRNDWEKAGEYDTKMKYGWEDWELWIRMLKNGGEVLKLPYSGFYYRIRRNSMIRNMNEQQKSALINYVTRKHFGFMIGALGVRNALIRTFRNHKDSNTKTSNLAIPEENKNAG